MRKRSGGSADAADPHAAANRVPHPGRSKDADSGDLRRDACPGGRLRQRLAVPLHRLDPLVDDPAQLGVDGRLVVAVAAGADDARALADKAAILVGPLNDLDVPGAVAHGVVPLG